MKLSFSKMHGLGNDFMVIDATSQPFTLDTHTIGQLGNRKTGIGFDQLLVVGPSQTEGVDFNYRIFNTDGSEVEHCGNGARCFAHFVVNHGLTDKRSFTVQVKKGLIGITYHDEDTIEVDMGHPIFNPAEIPFIHESDEYQSEYEITIGEHVYPISVVSMGNPHAVVFVSDVWNQDIEKLGSAIQQSEYFPESVNVNFAECIGFQTIELRTYERGVGETDACGTGACATAFAAHRLDLRSPNQQVVVRGGSIAIRLDHEERIFMSGPAREVYTGTLTLPL